MIRRIKYIIKVVDESITDIVIIIPCGSCNVLDGFDEIFPLSLRCHDVKVFIVEFCSSPSPNHSAFPFLLMRKLSHAGYNLA